MTPLPRPAGDPSGPRYLRPEGNLKVRRRRRARTTARVVAWCSIWAAGAILAAAGFHQGARLLMDPSRFPLRNVIVQGAPEATAGAVRAALVPLLGRNVLTIPLADVERMASSHSGILSARVQRRLPSSLLVTVEVRRPEALALFGTGIRLIGADGRDMGPYGADRAAEDHPILAGAMAGAPEEAPARIARGLEALRRLQAEAPGFVEELSVLDLSRGDRLTATLRTFRPPVLLNPGDPARNLDRLADVRRRLEAEDLDVEYVDLRFKGRAAVRPAREGAESGGA